jgi:uncharacterized repeat protein (TIGR01451 family)
VLVAGGTDVSAVTLNSAEIYDPLSNTWSAAASMASSHADAAAIALADGTVLVVGGVSSTGTFLVSAAERYDGSTNTWSSAGTLTLGGRTAASIAFTEQGDVLVAGGKTGAGAGSATSSAEVYDPDSGSWSATASMGSTRTLHTATALPDGRVLVAGGTTSTTKLASAELYDTREANLAIDKSGPASAPVRGVAAYPVTVTNNGPDAATNVVVTDRTPAGATFDSVSAAGWSCTPPTRKAPDLTCTLASLGSGAQASLTVSYKMKGRVGSTVTNVADVSSDISDPNTADNSDSAVTTITK